MKVEIKDSLSLERDMSSKAVINTNKSAYQQRLKIKKNKESEAEASDQLKSDVEELKNDMAEIKSMLEKLVGG